MLHLQKAAEWNRHPTDRAENSKETPEETRSSRRKTRVTSKASDTVAGDTRGLEEIKPEKVCHPTQHQWVAPPGKRARRPNRTPKLSIKEMLTRCTKADLSARRQATQASPGGRKRTRTQHQIWEPSKKGVPPIEAPMCGTPR